MNGAKEYLVVRMCEHCKALAKALVPVLGAEATTVILDRVNRELHGEPATG